MSSLFSHFPSHLTPAVCTGVRNSCYKSMLLSYLAIISGSRKHWKTSLHPSLPPPSSITVSPSVCPCASAAILPSSLSLPGVLCFFASSPPHQPPSSPLTHTPHPPPSIPLLFSSHATPQPPHSISTSVSTVLPLLDSILFFSPTTATPSSPRSLSFSVSPCIKPLLISLSHSASCWGFIIRYNISRSLSSLLCVLCFISSTWSNYLAFIAVPVSLSLSHSVCLTHVGASMRVSAARTRSAHVEHACVRAFYLRAHYFPLSFFKENWLFPASILLDKRKDQECNKLREQWIARTAFAASISFKFPHYFFVQNFQVLFLSCSSALSLPHLLAERHAPRCHRRTFVCVK